MHKTLIMALVTLINLSVSAISADQAKSLAGNYELVEIHEGNEYKCRSNISIEISIDQTGDNIDQVMLYENTDRVSVLFNFSEIRQGLASRDEYSVIQNNSLFNFNDQPVDISGIEVYEVTQIRTRAFSERRLRDKITLIEYDTPTNLFIRALGHSLRPFLAPDESVIVRECSYKKIRD